MASDLACPSSLAYLLCFLTSILYHFTTVYALHIALDSAALSELLAARRETPGLGGVELDALLAAVWARGAAPVGEQDRVVAV